MMSLDDMRAVIRRIQEVGLIPTLHALQVPSLDDFRQGLTNRGGLARDYLNTPLDNHPEYQVEAAWAGYFLLGPCGDGKWLKYYLSQDSWYGSNNQLQFRWFTCDYDPRDCDFLTSCECTDEYDCTYCDMGDDYCIVHAYSH